MDRAETGRTGEAVAARYYQKQGCELVAHNYRTRMGEIDLILREPDGTLVLCEVKTPQPRPAGRTCCGRDPLPSSAGSSAPRNIISSTPDRVMNRFVLTLPK